MTGIKSLAQLQRSLKGAPALLIIALVLNDGPQTVKMLSQHSSYSDRVVREGLWRLEALGLVTHNPDLRAWSLEPQSMLLTLIGQALLGSTASARGALTPGAEQTVVYQAPNKLSTELSTGPSSEDDFAPPSEEYNAGDAFLAGSPRRGPDRGRENFSGRGHDFSPNKAESCAERFDCQEDFSPAGDDSAAAVDFSSMKGEESSAPPGSITTVTTTTTKPNQTVVSNQVKPANTRNARSTDRDRRKIMAYWLERGGIGRKTPKMRELLASDLDLETVKAHVLERLAWEAGLIREGPPYSPGLLITKLLSGDPPPRMRCEQCLALPDKLGLCRCDYDLLVHR